MTFAIFLYPDLSVGSPRSCGCAAQLFIKHKATYSQVSKHWAYSKCKFAFTSVAIFLLHFTSHCCAQYIFHFLQIAGPKELWATGPGCCSTHSTPFSALMRHWPTSRVHWVLHTPLENVAIANALHLEGRPTWPLTFKMALHICSILAVPWSSYVPNLSDIEQSAA